MATDISSTHSSPSRHLTVVDVYDLASSIKFDLDSIVRHYGQQCVQDLACKVVSALETLEALAKNNERVNAEISELQKTVDRLQNERLAKLRDKENFEKDMIELEESLKKENDDLWQMVRTLQSEKSVLENKIANLSDLESEQTEQQAVREEEFQVLLNMKQVNSEQKEKIKDLTGSVRKAEKEAEELRGHIEKLFAQNYELIRKNKSLQRQCKGLIKERMDLATKVETMEETTLNLRQTLRETSRACRDLELQQKRPEDSDTPRFSINELREVLQEKTSLKQKLIQLQEELESFKIGRPDSSACLSDTNEQLGTMMTSGPSSTATTSVCDSEFGDGGVEKSNNSGDVVYGPINREPDEKLHPWKYQRKASGIRRMFSLFFPASPR
ncbi:hypothetical protein M3Y99_01355300 [Aphelenchoides fujianensis]|nr:hypothetical protein M3Y99_01355300 [Aphelenchoides fujianensis]